MRNLLLQIPDLTYDELAELGRSLIPPSAHEWTDHNAHDPGIMLMELLASVADRQVYSLSRTRRDERRAYARLMGVQSTGPVPATGLVWPDTEMADDPESPVPWVRGTVVDAERSIQAAVYDAPEFHVDRSIYLTTCKLVRMQSVSGDGSTQELTQVNRHGEATYFPLGVMPTARSRLRLEFGRGSVRGAGIAVGRTSLSIGVRAAFDRAEQGTSGFTRLHVTLTDTHGERDIDIVEDTTDAFTRTGAILLAIDARTMSIDDAFTLSFDCPGGGWLAVPRVSRIAANVLPVTQKQEMNWVDFATAQGHPDEELAAPAPQAGTPSVNLATAVDAIAIHASENGQMVDWHVVPDFCASGPLDRHVIVDAASSTMRAGNEVNGRAFSPGSTVQTRFVASAGARGNLAAGLDWKVAGIPGHFGRNLDSMRGGRDASVDLDLQVQARAAFRSARPIVSSADLVDAALALAGLDVARAEELTGGTMRRLASERRLVVVRRHESEQIAPEMREPRAWLQRIRGLLAPRLPLGQRLEVLPPKYVAVRVHATLGATPRVALEGVKRAAIEALQTRLASTAPNGSQWPFGRHLSRTAIAGWLRKVEGVARIVELSLSADGKRVSTGELSIPRDGLPSYEFVEGDLVVVRADKRGTA